MAIEALDHCCKMLRADLRFIWKKRCSDVPSTIVDHLSHGDLQQAKDFLPEGQVVHCAWPTPLAVFMETKNPEEINLPKMVEEFLLRSGPEVE